MNGGVIIPDKNTAKALNDLARHKAGYLQRAYHQRSELKVSCVRKFAKVLGAEMQDLMEGMLE